VAYLDPRNRAPTVERLPDDRLRITRIIDALNQVPKNQAELTRAGLWYAWGTADTEYPNCRLIKQTVLGQKESFPDESKAPPRLLLVYEEIPATAEVMVGEPAVSRNQYGYFEVVIESLQFSAGTAIYSVPGTTAAPGPWTQCILREQQDTDDGTLRTIKRTYVEGGQLSDTEELKFGGKLLLRTLKYLNEIPPTPAGYTLVTESVEFIHGLPLYSYGYASASGSIGAGGEISRGIQYNMSPDQGATGVTVTRIQYVTDLSVTTNPITGPVGSELIQVDFDDRDGFRVWTAVYAAGQGLVTSDVDTKDGGKLIIYSRTSINAAPAAPSATIGGTVTLLGQRVRNGTDAAAGTVIYDYTWAEGVGEVGRSYTNSNGGAVDFDPAAPNASIGPVICTIRYLTALSVTSDPTTRPPSFVRIGIDYQDADGYRVWSVKYGYGAGMVVDDVDYRNLGKLKIFHRVALGAPPDTPEATNEGAISAINVTDGGSGYTSAPSVVVTGGGGSGVSALAVLAPTTVASVALVSGGAGYRDVPVVSLSGGGGSGALAAATLTPTTVASLSLVEGGSGYTSAPSVTLIGGGGTGATAVATLSGRTVASITITNAGSGYTSAPTIIFSGGGGTGAAATAVLTPTTLASVTLTNGGSGYTSAPVVTVSGGGGGGAVVDAVLAGAAVASISVTNGGTGYSSAPTIGFSGGGGTGAAATANMADGDSVAAVTVTSPGVALYLGAPLVTFSGGGGSGAAGTAVLEASGGVRAQPLTVGDTSGWGYSSAPTVSFTGGGGTGAAGTAVLGTTGRMYKVAIGSGGSGYGSAPTVGFSGGGGSGAAATAIVSGGAVVGITITNVGSGYTSAPTVNFSGGGGSGASATAYLDLSMVLAVVMTDFGTGYTSAPTVGFTGGSPAQVASTTAVVYKGVASVTMTNGGSGYTSTPSVSFQAAFGSAATGTAVRTKTVSSITITNAGSGYTSAPTVGFSGGGGSGAAATAALSAAAVASLTLSNPGSGFTSTPTLTITGGGGGGATGTAALTATTIASATVTNAGADYTSAPTISFSGGGGTGAAATAVLGSTASVATVTLTAPGSGYTSAPTVGFTGGSGTGASAAALLTATSVASVAVTAPGSGFTSAPSVAFFGSTGSGASATAALAPSYVSSVSIISGGSGFTTIPTIGFSFGTATAFATLAADPGIVNLISAKFRHEDGYDLYDYSWAEGIGVIEERISLRDGGLRLENWVSFGLQAGTAVFTPPGVPLTIDEELGDGVTKYSVTCMQNNLGGDPTTGVALEFEDYLNFTYPGRAKIYSMTFSLWSSGTGYVYDVFKSPPIQIQVEGLVQISYQTSPIIGALPYPLWNPTEWATLRANWQGLDAYAKAEVQTLYGYISTGSASLAFTAPAYPSSVSILGINALQNSSGAIHLTGGPADPGGTQVTILAKLDPVFVDFYGVQYYRKTLITATIPAQPSLPV